MKRNYIDGEKLTDLRFGDGVALTTSTVNLKDMETQLMILNKGSKKVRKTKHFTNLVKDKNINIKDHEIGRVGE